MRSTSRHQTAIHNPIAGDENMPSRTNPSGAALVVGGWCDYTVLLGRLGIRVLPVGCRDEVRLPYQPAGVN